MNKMFYVLLFSLFVPVAAARDCSPLLDFDVRTLGQNTEVNLCDAYRGQVILVVNTASRCAYTDQYAALEELYGRYRAQGFVVLGFPSNDFAGQEPGSEQQIKRFCRLTYGVEFPMFAKTRVSRSHADGFYTELAQAAGRYPQWNFHKYLIGRDGRLVADYPGAVDPMDESMINAISRELRKVTF